MSKEENLIQSIQSGDLARVRHAIESDRCPVGGRNPWQQLPLNTAAAAGHLPVVDYLLEQGAMPDTMTVLTAIQSGHIDVLRRLVEDHDVELTARHYETGFRAAHRDLAIYLFRHAFEGEWFDRSWPGEDVASERPGICEAARAMLADRQDVRSDALAILRNGGATHLLHGYPDGESPLRLLFILAGRGDTAAFAAIWPIVHADLFMGARYAGLENHALYPEIEQLMMLALESNASEIFALLLGYCLPVLPRCAATARARGNLELADYLERAATGV